MHADVNIVRFVDTNVSFANTETIFKAVKKIISASKTLSKITIYQTTNILSVILLNLHLIFVHNAFLYKLLVQSFKLS